VAATFPEYSALPHPSIKVHKLQASSPGLFKSVANYLSIVIKLTSCSDAKFLRKLSYAAGSHLPRNAIADAADQVKFYLQELAVAGAHVLHSVPIYHDAAFGISALGLQVISGASVTVNNLVHDHVAPLLLLVGVYRSRTLPAIQAAIWRDAWLRVEQTACGILALSEAAFIEKYVIPFLGDINAETTIVARSLHEGNMVPISLWKNSSGHSHRLTPWRRAQTDGWIWEGQTQATNEEEFYGDEKLLVKCEYSFTSCLPNH
jgi:hypothetical protein